MKYVNALNLILPLTLFLILATACDPLTVTVVLPLPPTPTVTPAQAPEPVISERGKKIRALRPISYWLASDDLTDIEGRNDGDDLMVADHQSLNNPIWTVVMTFNTDSRVPRRFSRLVEKGGYQSVQGGFDIEAMSSDGNSAYDKVSCLIWGRTSGPYQLPYRVDSIAPMPIDHSDHTIVCSYDGSQLKFYLDGALQGSVSAPYIQDNHDLAIGRASLSNDFHFDGVLSDIAYFDRVIGPWQL